MPHNASFWQVALLDVVLPGNPDKSRHYVITLELCLGHHNTYKTFTFYRVLTSSASISSPNSSSTFLSTVGVIGVVGTAVAGDVGVNGGRYQENLQGSAFECLAFIEGLKMIQFMYEALIENPVTV